MELPVPGLVNPGFRRGETRGESRLKHQLGEARQGVRRVLLRITRHDPAQQIRQRKTAGRLGWERFEPDAPEIGGRVGLFGMQGE